MRALRLLSRPTCDDPLASGSSFHDLVAVIVATAERYSYSHTFRVLLLLDSEVALRAAWVELDQELK